MDGTMHKGCGIASRMHHRRMALRRRYPSCPFPCTFGFLPSRAPTLSPASASLWQWHSAWSNVARPSSRWPTTKAFRRSPRCSTWASKPCATTATRFSSRASSSLVSTRPPGDRSPDPIATPRAGRLAQSGPPSGRLYVWLLEHADNWLQVFRRAEATLLGSERRRRHQTRTVREEKCVGL